MFNLLLAHGAVQKIHWEPAPPLTVGRVPDGLRYPPLRQGFYGEVLTPVALAASAPTKWLQPM